MIQAIFIKKLIQKTNRLSVFIARSTVYIKSINNDLLLFWYYYSYPVFLKEGCQVYFKNRRVTKADIFWKGRDHLLWLGFCWRRWNKLFTL